MFLKLDGFLCKTIYRNALETCIDLGKISMKTGEVFKKNGRDMLKKNIIQLRNQYCSKQKIFEIKLSNSDKNCIFTA